MVRRVPHRAGPRRDGDVPDEACRYCAADAMQQRRFATRTQAYAWLTRHAREHPVDGMPPRKWAVPKPGRRTPVPPAKPADVTLPPAPWPAMATTELDGEAAAVWADIAAADDVEPGKPRAARKAVERALEGRGLCWFASAQMHRGRDSAAGEGPGRCPADARVRCRLVARDRPRPLPGTSGGVRRGDPARPGAPCSRCQIEGDRNDLPTPGAPLDGRR